ncbi:MAG: hypothetical protein ACYC9K_00895 [Sulfuricaulis sp.]
MKKCPLFKTKCKEHACQWWVNVQGVHPQTGDTVNAWDCSVNWIPVLVVDVARQARNGAAATESFRNLVLKMSQPSVRDDVPPVDVARVENARINLPLKTHGH